MKLYSNEEVLYIEKTPNNMGIYVRTKMNNSGVLCLPSSKICMSDFIVDMCFNGVSISFTFAKNRYKNKNNQAPLNIIKSTFNIPDDVCLTVYESSEFPHPLVVSLYDQHYVMMLVLKYGLVNHGNV